MLVNCCMFVLSAISSLLLRMKVLYYSLPPCWVAPTSRPLLVHCACCPVERASSCPAMTVTIFMTMDCSVEFALGVCCLIKSVALHKCIRSYPILVFSRPLNIRILACGRINEIQIPWVSSALRGTSRQRGGTPDITSAPQCTKTPHNGATYPSGVYCGTHTPVTRFRGAVLVTSAHRNLKRFRISMAELETPKAQRTRREVTVTYVDGSVQDERQAHHDSYA